MKYLFVDANNLGCRSSFANLGLSVDRIDPDSDFNPDDALKLENHFPTGAMHGFFRTLAAVRRMSPDRMVCVVWDGKSKKRILESRDAVSKGTVPSAYKENRKHQDAVAAFHVQRPEIMAALSMTNMPQVVKADEEADDVIASYVTKLAGNDIVILTNDHDYYQLLDEGVSILTSNSSVIGASWFRNKYGIEPRQWVEVGGMQGDDGDNIFGIPWWGEGTAVKEIIKHGSCASIMASYHAQCDALRAQHPDVSGEQFEELKNAETADKKKKFPHVREWMPFTGVARSYLREELKLPRNVVMALVYESRIPLALSLKAMHRDIRVPDLPSLDRGMEGQFVEFCRKYALEEVERSADVLCGKQCAT